MPPRITRNGCGKTRITDAPLVPRGVQAGNSSGGTMPLPSRPGHGLNTPASKRAQRLGIITPAQVAAARADDARRSRTRSASAGGAGGAGSRGGTVSLSTARRMGNNRSTATSRRTKKKRATAGEMHKRQTASIHNKLGKRGGNLKRL